ncbi:MAG: hypothetical protein GY733_24030 [bacterium]|nr:hypothetical protein [bacterium]
MRATMQDPQPLRDLLHRALARYLTVTPGGFILDGRVEPVPRLVVHILGYGGARTLYQQRKPVCRSFDGVAAVTNPAKTCDPCPQADSCTPQVRLDLVIEGRPHRLLLAFTSAKNFLAYVGRLDVQKVAVDAVRHELLVIPRRGWGEVQFREGR